MFSERTSVGLDVHARSVVACAIDTVTGELFRARLCPDPVEVLGWIGQLAGPVAVAYEAGPTGFGLARAVGADRPTEATSGQDVRLARSVHGSAGVEERGSDS